ncbi:MAG: histidinol dehydrogenase [Methanobacteriaceae archaeon]|jgi:histidinol dehydrogenase|nr:histidinol dehydrogenase [Methanobacteriaceae archaeon]
MKISKLKQMKKENRDKLLGRSQIGAEVVLDTVSKIIGDVRHDKDQALISFCEKFDGVKLENLQVPQVVLERSTSQVDKTLLEALNQAAENIQKFHQAQLPPEWICNVTEGVSAGQIIRPVETVGCYIPGGRAVYLSTILMTIIPARIAGVSRIICCTPPDENGQVKKETLAAARLAGADEVYAVGGAQAVAAMAYGTETIPQVDKIVGPGNIYVTTAKKLVYGDVDIDFPAGPSEVLIIADATANPEYMAIDLMAQAEHDPDAACVLVTTSQELAESVNNIIKDEVESASRKEIIEESLEKFGQIILVENLMEAVEFSNQYAPEHLIIMTREPEQILENITSAGSIFLGELTPVAAGDYGSGTNHVLPTSGCARFYGGLSTESFLKKPTVQRLTEEGLKNLEKMVITLAEYEGLYSHAESFRKRLKDIK